jgi:SAM-dependent methyltransferase
VDEIYDRRFHAAERPARAAVWQELAAFLQRWVPPDSAVIDIACGQGGFISNIDARERWASDVRDVAADLGDQITFVHAGGLSLRDHVPSAHFGVAFISNYLEHLASPEEVVHQLEVVRDIVRPGGRVIVLQPNVRLIGGAYWDFIDHRVPLTDRSLREAAETAGFETEVVHPRFLPYTFKSRLPRGRALVRAYLAFRPAWFLFGKQTLYVGRRPRH